MTCWAGLSAFDSSAPTVCSRIRAIMSLTTLKLTSASSRARRISRRTSSTSASPRRPRVQSGRRSPRSGRSGCRTCGDQAPGLPPAPGPGGGGMGGGTAGVLAGRCSGAKGRWAPPSFGRWVVGGGSGRSGEKVEDKKWQRGEMWRRGQTSAWGALLAVSGVWAEVVLVNDIDDSRSGTGRTTTAAPPKLLIRRRADLAAIEEMYRAQSAGWKTSIDEGLRVRAETAWPAGAWTPQMIWAPPMDIPGRRRTEMIDGAGIQRRTALEPTRAGGRPDGEPWVGSDQSSSAPRHSDK